MSHYRQPQEFISLPKRSDEMTVSELQTLAIKKLCERVELRFGRDIIEKFVCPQCDSEEYIFSPLGKVRVSHSACPNCHRDRKIEFFNSIRGGVSFKHKTFAQIGVPKFDIIWARNWEKLIGFEFSKDAHDVLGCLCQPSQE